ncbi:MAG: 5-methylthioadenosine/S-adenosylhomocysteine deaminase [Actinomycetota bacterium]|nr:5-methylthioadenosine/S-adenosylhomocysteine deaminase [Actinomycetota bacterium]
MVEENEIRAVRSELAYVDGTFRPNTSVVISGDRIVDVCSTGDEPVGAAVEQWGAVALVPGTVNAHGHAFQNLFKGIADDRTFESWRADVLYPLSATLDREAIYTGALFAFAEALAAGVTTTTDFFYLHDGSNDNAEVVLQAARDIGIRLVLARAFYDLDAPTAAPLRYRESASDAAERTRSLARAHADEPLLSVQPAPHSLHAASPETIGVALDVARELDVGCHLHLAEARYEVDLIAERFGTTPVRLLEREGLLDPRLICIHSVWLDDEELDLVAGSGAGIVHCPGANAFLGDGFARLRDMLDRNIPVALGPDGGCANNRQNVFDEMRMASLVAKGMATDGAALDARTAFELGTVTGARMLNIAAGSIQPDRFADLVALDLGDLSLQPVATLDKNVVNSMQQTAIARVMVGGTVVWDEGGPTRIDAGELRARIAAVAGGLPG